MKWRWDLIWLFAALLTFGCPSDGCDSGAGPSPVEPPTTTTTTTIVEPEPTLPPRVDRAPSIHELRLYSAFALAIRDAATIQNIAQNAMLRGWNCPRVCGEVQSWPGTGYLPRGPGIRTTEALENVRRLLDTTARIPGVFVMLVPVCTIKEDGTPFSEIKWWTEQVAAIAADYKHVVFEAVNEHWHPRSSLRDERKVIQLIDILKRTGHLVGSDDNVVEGNVTYNRGLMPHVDFVSVHPWRNPDPSGKDIERIVDRNGGEVVLSETTSYVSEEDLDLYGLRGNGLVTTSREQIRLYGRRCKRVPGCIFCFHSVDGLKADGVYGWMPIYEGM